MTRSADGLSIGGLPVERLAAPPAVGASAAIVSAEIAPGRGMMLLQATAEIPGRGRVELLATPPLAEAAERLDGGPADFCGNASFGLGGAILLPFANRITGNPVEGRAEIVTEIAGEPHRLPANWGGKAPGAQRYAMHGLILAEPFAELERETDRILGRRDFGAFGGRWPSRTGVEIGWALVSGALELTVVVRNLGERPLPVGIGWHPWFALSSGRRGQARLKLPAACRALVKDYDEVLPTGALAPAEGDYDFRAGRALGDLYLDDCFTGLGPHPLTIELADPAAGFGVRLTTASPAVKAVQVYAPTDRPVVVIEPQFNLADPFSDVWAQDLDTGMMMLPPGGAAEYSVRMEVY
jgi:galactose mutarotase-like enzyme